MELQSQIAEMLIEKGNELSRQPYKEIEFTKNKDANNLLNNLDQFPHAFVLGCVMDQQISAERAWLIPYRISQEIGGFDFEKFQSLDLSTTKMIFARKGLHRFNDKMAEYFYSAVQHINTEYNGDASNMWCDNPKSATLVRRFLGFKGAGIKISTMATNILVRSFKIPVQDQTCIDISPDVHVKRVFTRLGFISKDASNDELIYCAKNLNPEYPGIFDFSAWEIGKEWCRPTNPDCNSCYLESLCPQNNRSI